MWIVMFHVIIFVCGYIVGAYRTTRAAKLRAKSEIPSPSPLPVREMSEKEKQSYHPLASAYSLLYSQWQKGHNLEIRNQLINFLDNERLATMPQSEREQLVEIVYGMWCTNEDERAEACLRNLYDNNSRRAIWSHAERAKLIRIMNHIAETGSQSALKALENQDRK